MLVKKVNPEWSPSENNGLQVGDTIDITNPKDLILNGSVVAVDENGSEKSSYELYGILAGTEKEEFEQWLTVKKQKELQEKLAKESEELQKESEELKKQVKEEVKKVEPKVEEKKKGKSAKK